MATKKDSAVADAVIRGLIRELGYSTEQAAKAYDNARRERIPLAEYLQQELEKKEAGNSVADVNQQS